MRGDDIEFGVREIGLFRIQICPCVFETRQAEDVAFFEVMVSERKVEDGWSFYTHLVEDPRFDFFSFVRWERTIGGVEELVEFNTYINRKHNVQPTWKLSRSAVMDVVEACQKINENAERLLRALKKKSKPKKEPSSGGSRIDGSTRIGE